MIPVVGGWIVAVCAFLFGYTTLIGWAYYGEQFLEYILGRKVTVPYRWIYCLLIPFGAISRVEVVWAWGDLMNALQVFPNLIGVIGLSGLVAKAARGSLVPVSPLDRHGIRCYHRSRNPQPVKAFCGFSTDLWLHRRFRSSPATRSLASGGCQPAHLLAEAGRCGRRPDRHGGPAHARDRPAVRAPIPLALTNG